MKVVRAALTVLVFAGIGALVALLISSRTDSAVSWLTQPGLAARDER